MPFQPINFANIAPQGLPGIRTAAQDFTQGYQGSQQTKMNELMNALKQLELQQAPEKFKTEMDYKKAMLQKALQGSNGISISFDPETGKPMIQIGGSGGKGSAQNGIYATDNEQITNLTPANRTRAQQQLTGIETVMGLMPRIQNLAEFQTAKGQLINALSKGSNYLLGSEFSAPSRQADAEAALESAREALLTGFNLRATDKALESVKQILIPHSGESPQGYKDRLMRQMTELQKIYGTTERHLYGGMRRESPEQFKTNLGLNQKTDEMAAKKAYWDSLSPEQKQQLKAKLERKK